MKGWFLEMTDGRSVFMSEPQNENQHEVRRSYPVGIDRNVFNRCFNSGHLSSCSTAGLSLYLSLSIRLRLLKGVCTLNILCMWSDVPLTRY